MEMVFSIIYRFGNHAAFAVLGVSITVSLLTLPLYKRAEEIQEEERKKQSAMEKWVAHIKKTFSGDERFFMLSTYYRQNEYNPLYSLRSSISLLLQIPFFIAAYNYLSKLEVLKHSSFWIFSNLGEPDHLISIAGQPINILPVLMTVLNLASAFLYSKDLKLKDKIQPVVLALVFLALLYNSPSGLVLYWTFNQCFSLLKNIVSCFRKEKKSTESSNRIQWVEVLIPELAMLLLLGLVIPLSVLSSSPIEFVSKYGGPIDIIVYTGSLYFGLLLVWTNIFIALSNGRINNRIWIPYAILSICIVDYFLFSQNFGLMSTYFSFGPVLLFKGNVKLINLLVVICALVVCIVLYKKARKVLLYAGIITSLAFFVLAVVGIVEVNSNLKKNSTENLVKEYEPIFKLSSTNDNVVVIMLDRALGPYIPYIFDELPELKNQYKGFTYYQNTISFGGNTNFCTPAVFGGYEYTPEELNKRDKELLKDKHNEALKVLPDIFSKNGYEITLCDLSYANYTQKGDLSIFDEYDGIRTMHTRGEYVGNELDGYMDISKHRRQNGAKYYSVFRVTPLLIQGIVYQGGKYFDEDYDYIPVSEPFIEWFTVLSHFIPLTEISDSESSLTMIVNESTHEPMILGVPGYTLGGDSDSLDYLPQRFEAKEHKIKMSEAGLASYDVNAASLKEIGKWLEYLQKKDVYDNTRIIIAADHGIGLGQFEDLLTDTGLDAQSVAPLLMIKDFGSSHEFCVSDDFMTNADVPTEALKGLFDNPINPFTGSLISSRKKDIEKMKIMISHKWNVDLNNGTTFDPSDNMWYSVHDDIWNKENWGKIGKELPKE